MSFISCNLRFPRIIASIAVAQAGVICYDVVFSLKLITEAFKRVSSEISLKLETVCLDGYATRRNFPTKASKLFQVWYNKAFLLYKGSHFWSIRIANFSFNLSFMEAKENKVLRSFSCCQFECWNYLFGKQGKTQAVLVAQDYEWSHCAPTLLAAYTLGQLTYCGN